MMRNSMAWQSPWGTSNENPNGIDPEPTHDRSKTSYAEHAEQPITEDGWPPQTAEPHASEEQRDQHRADARPSGKVDENMREVLAAGIPEDLSCPGGIRVSQQRVKIVLLLFLQPS